MKINKDKYKLALARACMSKKDLVKSGIPVGTLSHVGRDEMMPVTVGRIARALGCDVTDIID